MTTVGGLVYVRHWVRMHTDAHLEKPWACRVAQSVATTGDPVRETPDCYRIESAILLKNHVPQLALNSLQYMAVYRGMVGDETEGIPVLAQMTDHVLVTEVACYGCLAAVRLWKYCWWAMSATVMLG